MSRRKTTTSILTILATTMTSSLRTHALQTLPKLVVFDLDMCLWSPEMYELSHRPTKSDTILGPLQNAGTGCRAVRSGRSEIRLFDGALQVLQRIHRDEYPGMKVAVASSADTKLAEEIGGAAMRLLEVVPGVTMREVLERDGFPNACNIQVGRRAPLSSSKHLTHFPILEKKTGIAYEDMLFFDDSNWSDHVGLVEQHCGVVGVRTPNGMRFSEWEDGLKKYAQMKAKVM